MSVTSMSELPPYHPPSKEEIDLFDSYLTERPSLDPADFSVPSKRGELLNKFKDLKHRFSNLDLNENNILEPLLTNPERPWSTDIEPNSLLFFYRNYVRKEVEIFFWDEVQSGQSLEYPNFSYDPTFLKSYLSPEAIVAKFKKDVEMLHQLQFAFLNSPPLSPEVLLEPAVINNLKILGQFLAVDIPSFRLFPTGES